MQLLVTLRTYSSFDLTLPSRCLTVTGLFSHTIDCTKDELQLQWTTTAGSRLNFGHFVENAQSRFHVSCLCRGIKPEDLDLATDAFELELADNLEVLCPHVIINAHPG